MIRVHNSDYVPKYKNGKWHFDGQNNRLHFIKYDDLEILQEEYIYTNGYQFRRTLNQIEELIFRQEFARNPTLPDGNVVLLKDIRQLVCFLMPKTFLRPDFLRFLYTSAVTNFLHALIIYFEYFLKFVEFVLVRREEIAGDTGAQIQTKESNEIKVIYSNYLQQYRLLLAREYSVILLGEGEMSQYHHMKSIINISMTIKDRHFFERFLAVAQQIVWIAMHRRAYDYIDAEMGRLFRSEHFQLKTSAKMDFTPAEMDLLYGRNYRRVNYRTQNSPLIQELNHIAAVDKPILWIGEHKYRGTDKRIAELELEYILPDAELCLIDVVHGILGHPKHFYNTLLELSRSAVRAQNFTEADDPYQIVRQPYLRIPSIEAHKLRCYAQQYESYYEIIKEPCHIGNRMLKMFLFREDIIKMCSKENLLTNVWKRANASLQSNSNATATAAVLVDELESILSRLAVSYKEFRKNGKFKRKPEKHDSLETQTLANSLACLPMTRIS